MKFACHFYFNLETNNVKELYVVHSDNSRATATAMAMGTAATEVQTANVEIAEQSTNSRRIVSQNETAHFCSNLKSFHCFSREKRNADKLSLY